MTRDEILTMASESYCWHINLSWDQIASIARLQRFAELVAKKEREACAALCDKISDEDGFEGGYAAYCADMIRARSNSEVS